MKTRSYDIAAVLSVLNGVIVHPKGEKKILSMLSFMVGSKVKGENMQEAMKFCKPALVGRYSRFNTYTHRREVKTIHRAIEQIRKFPQYMTQTEELIEFVLTDWKQQMINVNTGYGLAVPQLDLAKRTEWLKLMSQKNI